MSLITWPTLISLLLQHFILQLHGNGSGHVRCRVLFHHVATLLYLLSQHCNICKRHRSRSGHIHLIECTIVNDIRITLFLAWGNLANILNTQGKTAEAEDAYRAALRHRGNMADVHYNL